MTRLQDVRLIILDNTVRIFDSLCTKNPELDTETLMAHSVELAATVTEAVLNHEGEVTSRTEH